jgi:hypothetical protein
MASASPELGPFLYRAAIGVRGRRRAGQPLKNAESRAANAVGSGIIASPELQNTRHRQA